MLKVPDGTIRILVQGTKRVRLGRFVATEPYLVATVEELEDVVETGPELEALTRNVQRTFSEIIEEIPYLPEELQLAVTNVDDPSALAQCFALVQRLNAEGVLLAYHDRSDGGLFATLAEMAFASRCSLDIELAPLLGRSLETLFNEELGAVVQVRRAALAAVERAATGMRLRITEIGRAVAGDRIRIAREGRVLLDERRADLHRAWSETSRCPPEPRTTLPSPAPPISCSSA